MALLPGSTLGPYEILSFIGAGGMGEVYRARDPRLNREVAIKVLPADRVADDDRRRRFVQEARAASALNHPHIITIYEIESGIYYVACTRVGVGSNADLHLINAATGQDRVLGTLEKFGTTGTFGLAVSPDGNVIVYERVLREGHDLMLIENFRSVN
jgi:serine/threonine protein kinase